MGEAAAPGVPAGLPAEEAGHGEAHAVVGAAFNALDRHGVPWALVRGAGDLAHPAGDVDVLVDRAWLPRLDSLLAEASLRRLGQRGHGTHRFYFAHHPDDDLWIKLDVVTAIEFGRLQQWRSPLAAGCLARRRRVAGIWRLDEADEAWLLLLHLLMDKAGVPPDRRVEALVACDRASTTAPVAAFLDGHLGAGTARRVLDVVRAGQAGEVARTATWLGLLWTRRAPIATAAGWLARRIARRLDLPVPGHPDGLIVAVVGPDGAGKTTLSEAIAASFPPPTPSVYMGIWGTGPWDAALRRVPGGRLVQRSARVLRGSLAARYHRRRGRLVLLDRFAHDVLLPGTTDRSLGGRVVSALALSLSPEPGTVLVLDAPGEVMFARKREHSAALLEQRRRDYLQLASRFQDSVVLDATEAPREVARRAVAAIWARWCARSPAGRAAARSCSRPGSRR